MSFVMAGVSSKQDEVFGLPFLFTGGLPNSLEKFSEGNLRCFLTYLIEVVGKANRQNVWQKPMWWKSKLIPYSPVSIDTSKLNPDQVLPELRGLVESCYKYYKADKILEVSKQLAEIPRILLGIKDNKDNTWTVYDKESKAVYVTVRPENLHYDEKSLDKVSNDWRSSFNKEDVTFTEIKKSSKAKDEIIVIELSDSEDEQKQNGKRESPRRKCKSSSPSSPENKDMKKIRNSLENNDSLNVNAKQNYIRSASLKSPASSTPIQPLNKPQIRSCGVVVRSGKDFVIALSDSDDDCESKQSFDRTDFAKYPVQQHSGYSIYNRLPAHNSQRNEIKSEQTKTRKKSHDDDVEFICEVVPSCKPCPKRFKKTNQAVRVSPNVIILSDSEEEEISTPYISSYTSLAKNYSGCATLFPETPNKNVQKSILGPLLCSPRKDPLQPQRVAKIALSPLKWPSINNAPKPPSPIKKVGFADVSPRSIAASKTVELIRESSSSDTEDVYKPTREELFLKKKKPRKIFYPKKSFIEEIIEPVDFSIKNQAEFMSLLGMNSIEPPTLPLKLTIKKPPLSERPNFITMVRSKYSSYSRMPLEWIQALSGAKNSVILTKKSSRYRQYDPTKINYEAFCSTNKSFVEYNIKSNSKVGKEGKSDRQVGRRGMEKKDRTIEKWFIQSEETAHRNKRASIRMLRSLCSGDIRFKPKKTLDIGTLAPTIERLPNNIFERALQMTVRVNDVIE